MKKTAIVSLVFLSLGFVSCTKWFWEGEDSASQGTTSESKPTRSPDEVVKEFVQLSGGAKEIADKAKLTNLCAGEMRRAFDRMSDEEFKMNYIEANLEIKEVKVLQSTLQQDQAKVIYQVTVENKGGTEPTTETNEREVELSLTQGQWYIEFIRLKGSDKLAFTRGMLL
jgi:hypothetical protein